MCGIAGIFKASGVAVSQEIIAKMSHKILHRGPDEEGFYRDRFIHLASRRLSIIDIAGGKQPVYSEDKSKVIVYNGELYNFADLKKQLLSKGHHFSTNSDTEVVLKAYLEWQEDCLQYFCGMFSFCIWDLNKQELFAVRDRMGIKPFYYSLLPDSTFIFASEIKALLEYPDFESKLHVKAIDNLFTYGFNLAPYTFFEGVKQLLPGHYLKVSKKGISCVEYWDIDLEAPLFTGSALDIAQNLKHEIEKSVKKRLVADVPVAAYLSGGIDSSIVAGMYSKFSNQQVKTISITFDQADYDESFYSRQVSQFFNTENIEFKCKFEVSELKNLIYYLEDPLVTLLHLPLFLLSQKVRDSGFKVVLSGDGADEILGGYDYFKLLKMMDFIGREPTDFRQNILRKMYPKITNVVQAKMQYMVLKSLPLKYPALPYRFQQFSFKNQFYSEKYMADLEAFPKYDLFFFNLDKIKHRSLIDQALYIETKLRLLNLTLPLSDKMSMANSVELRPIFLDHELVNFAFRIPDHLKIKGLNEKYILKEAMKGFLPDFVCNRKKQPLQPPGNWFVENAYEMIRDYLSKESVQSKGYFNYQFINKAFAEYDSKSAVDYSGVIIVAFFIHLWDELFIK